MMHKFTVLLATEKSFEESEMAQRLSNDCNIVLAHSHAEMTESMKVRSIPFSAFVIDTSDINTRIIDLVGYIRGFTNSSDIPIILIVDDTSDEVVNQGFDAGATDVIVRPYTVYAHRRVLNYIRLHDTAENFHESVRELHKAREDMDLLLTRMPGGLFRYKASYEMGKDVFDYVSPGLVQMLGCKTEEEFRNYTGNTFMGFVHPEDRATVVQEIREQTSVTNSDKITYRVIRNTGEVRWLEDWGNLVEDNAGERWFYCVVLDITEKVLEQQTFKTRAEHDSLTGVFNRAAAMHRVRAMRKGKTSACSLILMDVDNFKGINDNFGHPIGDEVLKHLAHFLDSMVRGGDIVARMGGDEFAVYLEGLGKGPRLQFLANKITTEAFKGFTLKTAEGIEMQPTVSLGISSSNDPAITIEELYAQSDSALYEAKRSGKNAYAYYDPDSENALEEDITEL